MTIPHTVRIGALVIATTAFYGYVGQMVPQKEVQPPAEIAIKKDITTAEMVKIGAQLMAGKGLCLTCHTIGKTGALRFPDLDGIDVRAKTRIPGLSDVEYFAQSMYEPDKFIVEGFNPGMPVINKPPIGLTDQEILCVIAYLQTLGGTATVTLETTHQYRGGGTTAPAPAPGAGSAPTAKPPDPAGKGARLTPLPAHTAPSALVLVRENRASAASKAPDRSEPAQRRARTRVGASEGRSPSVKSGVSR